MDKQFARILMLSVLLPAGAAVAEAIRYEHIAFTAMHVAVISKPTDVPRADMMRAAASGGRHVMEESSSEHGKHDQDGAHGIADESEKSR